MLCSKVSQKFNTKSMISKWFLKKSLKSSTIFLSNFPKFFYSKKKSQKMIPILSFYFTLHSRPKNSPTKRFSFRTFRKKNQSLESLEWRRRRRKKKNAWTFTRWITVSSVWKCRVRDRIHEIDGPIWNHSTPRAVGCSRKTQGAKGVVGKHRDVEGRRGWRGGVGSPHKTMLPHLSASSTSSPLRAAPSSP